MSAAAQLAGRITARVGTAFEVDFPDGSKLKFSADGNYVVEDSAARVTYKAARFRDFNRFVNAADMLDGFAEYVKAAAPAASRAEFKSLPLELFLKWLFLEAAREDGEDVEAEPIAEAAAAMLTTRVRPRCPYCQRFVRRSRAAAGFLACNGDHYEKAAAKVEGRVK